MDGTRGTSADLAAALEAYFASPDSAFVRTVRNIVKQEIHHHLGKTPYGSNPVPQAHQPLHTPPRLGSWRNRPSQMPVKEQPSAPAQKLEAQPMEVTMIDDDDAFFAQLDMESIIAEKRESPERSVKDSGDSNDHVPQLSYPIPSTATQPAPLYVSFPAHKTTESVAISPLGGNFSFSPLPSLNEVDSITITPSPLELGPSPELPQPQGDRTRRISPPSPSTDKYTDEKDEFMDVCEDEIEFGDEINDDDQEDEQNGPLLAQLFPEKFEMINKRREQRRRFNPPGVPVPTLPPEMLCKIASFLPMSSFMRFAQVCRYWRAVAIDSDNWMAKYKRNFGGPFPKALLEDYAILSQPVAVSDTNSLEKYDLDLLYVQLCRFSLAYSAIRQLPHAWYHAYLWMWLDQRYLLRYGTSKWNPAWNINKDSDDEEHENDTDRPTRNKRKFSSIFRPRNLTSWKARYRELLFWAAKHGHVVTANRALSGVERLIAAFSSANCTVEDFLMQKTIIWNSPIYEAVEYGHEEMLRLLLEYFSIRRCGLLDHPLTLACRKGYVNIAKLLLRHGELTNKRLRGFGSSPLHEAAGRGSVELVTLLLDHGVDPNFTLRTSKFTALADAVLRDHKDVVRILLQRGARPEICGTPVLHLAAERCYSEVVELLLLHGADPSKKEQIHPPYGHAITAVEAAGSEDIRRIFRRFSDRARRQQRRGKAMLMEDDIVEPQEIKREADDEESDERDLADLADLEDLDDKHTDEANEEVREWRRDKFRAKHAKNEDATANIKSEPVEEEEVGQEMEMEREIADDRPTKARKRGHVEHAAQDMPLRKGRRLKRKRSEERALDKQVDTASTAPLLESLEDSQPIANETEAGLAEDSAPAEPPQRTARRKPVHIIELEDEKTNAEDA